VRAQNSEADEKELVISETADIRNIVSKNASEILKELKTHVFEKSVGKCWSR
jgi:hypothetical protein